MIEVIFETHATSVDNEDDVASGHWDAPLSASGKRQARELGRRYEPGSLTEVFCSDLQRSSVTAEIAFGGRSDIVVQIDSRLRECDYGSWTRRTQSHVTDSRASRIYTPFPGGESYVACTERVREFLNELWNENSSRTILVIGHRATQFALENLLRGRRLEDIVSETWSWQPGWRYPLSRPLQ